MTTESLKVIDLNPIKYAMNASNVASLAMDSLRYDILPIIDAVVVLAGAYTNKELTRDDLIFQLLTIRKLAIAGERAVTLALDTLDGELSTAQQDVEALRGVNHG